MEFTPKKRNTPIVTLLKNYEEKKSGKVAESRRQLQWRFDALDWKDQKKILHAHLASCKSDREWAARKLVTYWDDCFIPILRNLWEEKQEAILAWPIIRYFPVDYVKANVERLGIDRNYFFVCLRLLEEKDFKIDESRLRETDLLNVYSNYPLILSKEKATDILFTIVNKLCRDKYPYHLNETWSFTVEKGHAVSILDNRVMKKAISTLERIGMRDVVKDFKDWHFATCEDLLKSDDAAKLFASRIKRYEYNYRRLILTKKNYYEHLDSKYKHTDEKPVFGIEYYHIWQDKQSDMSVITTLYSDVDEKEIEHYNWVQEKALEKLKEDTFIFI